MRWFILISLVVTLASAKVYTENELANRLKSFRTPEIIRTNYETWVCIARNKASYNTSFVDYSEKFQRISYGIFQISNDGWCKDWKESDNVMSHCGNNCSSFIDEDITDDLDCVAKILDISGIKAWGPAAEGCSKDDDFWGEGACVFPESYGKKDLNGEAWYPCFDTSLTKGSMFQHNMIESNQNSQYSSITAEDLVVIKRNETKCYGNSHFEYHPKNIKQSKEESAWKRSTPSSLQPTYSGGNIGCNSGKGYQTCEPIFIGCDDPDFISDGCDRNEIKMEGYGLKEDGSEEGGLEEDDSEDDGDCYGVLSHGPCGIDGIVLVDRTTKKGYCAHRFCSPDRVYLNSTDKCHDPREPGLCERSDHILYTDMYGDPICGCREGYYEKDCKCHQILTETDICPKGEVFWFKSFRGYPLCLPDPCKGDNINRTADQLPFAPFKNGKCYQIGSHPLEICDSDEFFSLDMEELEGDCEEFVEAGLIVYGEEEFDEVQELYGPPLHQDPETPAATRLRRRRQLGRQRNIYGTSNNQCPNGLRRDWSGKCLQRFRRRRNVPIRPARQSNNCGRWRSCVSSIEALSKEDTPRWGK